MPLVLANRVQETTATTGTGTITLAGAVSGYQSFAAIGNTNTTYYTITSGINWEVGIGTYSTTGPTLTRTTILSSSIGGAAITLVGISTVFVTYPADRAVTTDGVETLTNKTINGSNNTITNISLTTGVTGTLALGNGGTGVAALTSNALVRANTAATALQSSIVTDDGTTVTVAGGLTVSGSNTFITNSTVAVTLNSSAAAIQIAPNGSTAVITIGGSSATGVITLGRSTVSQTTNIQAGATASASTKTLNIGTGGLAGSTTAITIGGTAGTSTTTLNGTVTLANALAVANGGTGVGTITAGRLVRGNGTTAFTPSLVADDGTNVTVNGGLIVNGTASLRGAVEMGSSLLTGFGLATGDCAFELGGLRSADGNAFMDFHARAGTDFEARIIRYGGVNGGMDVINTGTGGMVVSVQGAAPLVFQTTAAERMRIDSAGNVGIGTSSPGARLDLAGTASGASLRLQNQTASTGKSYDIISGDSGPLRFQDITAGTERMRIDPAGNVGIGTSSPQQLLAVGNSTDQIGAGVSGAVTTLFFGTPSNMSGGIKRIAYDRASGGLTFIGGSVASPATQMTLDGSGNVGIGTSSPATRLDVRNGDIQVSRGAAGVAADAAINFGNNANNFIFSGNSANIMAFGVNGSERLRIDSAGNVGIGTSSPGLTLDIAGDAVRVTRAANPPVFLGRQSQGTLAAPTATISGDQIVAFGGFGYTGSAFTGTPAAAIRYLALETFTATANGAGIVFETTPIGSSTSARAERMRIDPAGNVGIGTSSPGARFAINGGSGTSQTRFQVSSTQVEEVATNAAANAYAERVTDAAQHIWKITGSERVRIDAAGNVGIGTSAPGAGTRLNVAGRGLFTGGSFDSGDGTASGVSITYDAGSNVGTVGSIQSGVSERELRMRGNALTFLTNGANERLRISSNGGITSSDLADAVGYKGIPPNSQTAAYTLALSDMGKHISITTGGVVIPANAGVAFPIGSTIVIYNNSAATQAISITTDTLRLAGTATVGTRTLAQRGIATCIKVLATEWVVTGNVT